jgi:hypothetical protein
VTEQLDHVRILRWNCANQCQGNDDDSHNTDNAGNDARSHAEMLPRPMNDADFACEPADGSGRFAATAA